MTARYEVDVELALRGARVDVGETGWCADCDEPVHEGAAVTVLARTRTGGWDVERLWCPVCAPTELDAESRDGEGVALAEGTLAIVLSSQQAWLAICEPDVLEWTGQRLNRLATNSPDAALRGRPMTSRHRS